MKTGMENEMAMKSEFNLVPEAAGYTPESAVEPLRQVSQRAGLDKLAEQLTQLREWMGVDLESLESELRSIDGFADVERSRDLAQRAAQHLLQRPGKRIRPLCLLLGAQLADLPVDARIRDMAVAAELVHAATLLHDDVLDEGTERRGEAARAEVEADGTHDGMELDPAGDLDPEDDPEGPLSEDGTPLRRLGL